MTPYIKLAAQLGLEFLVPGGGVVSLIGEFIHSLEEQKRKTQLNELIQKSISQIESTGSINPHLLSSIRSKLCAENQLLEVVLKQLETQQERTQELTKEIQQYKDLEDECVKIESERSAFKKATLNISKKNNTADVNPTFSWTPLNPFIPKHSVKAGSSNTFDLWNFIWLLSGQSFSNPSVENPLHGLPQPIQTALISTLRQHDAWCLGEFELCTQPLLHEGARLYRYYSNKKPTCFKVPKDLSPLEVGVALRKTSFSKVGNSILKTFSVRFCQAQNYFLEYFSRCSKPVIQIALSPDDDAAITLALIDVLTLAEKTSVYTQTPLRLPEVQLYVPETIGAVWHDPLHHFLGCEPTALFGEENALLVHQDKSPFWVELPKNIRFVHELSTVETLHSKDILDALSETSNCWIERCHLHPHELPEFLPQREILDFFARRFFPIAELKKEQLVSLQQLLCPPTNPSLLVILPTGYGKSLIYQLYAFLIPRLSLIISPLNALIEDQVTGLHALGFYPAVAALNSSVDMETRKAIMTKLSQYRLIYISPERLLITHFIRALEGFQIQGHQLGAFVVDEVHCASEWGHDFRLSYLQLSGCYKRFRQNQNSMFPLLGLTATAPKLVREDVCRILDIPEGQVEQRASSERQNFSFSFHLQPYDGGGNKPLGELIEEIIPKALNMAPDELWTLSGGRFHHAGIVFSLFVKSYLERKYFESLFPLKDRLSRLSGVDEDAIGVHGSSTPWSCTECASPLLRLSYNSTRRRRLLSCQSCKKVYSKKNGNYSFGEVSNWPQKIRRTQHKFKQDQLALMVATKGFGMGIDKPNIRYVIHHSLSSSISAYYQEAGRGGRDGRHAHISMLIQQPHPSCRAELESRGFRPKCMENTQKRSWYCPYGDQGLCDYGIQSEFIEKGFEPAERVIKTMTSCLNQQNEITDKPNSNTYEKAVFRLMQLGVYGGYRTEYRHLGKNKFKKYIFPDANELQAIKAQAAAHFKRLQDPESAQWVQETMFPNRIDYVHQAGTRLMRTIERQIRYQRYVMLYRLLTFAESTDCRRIDLRSIFDLQTELAQQNYRCGFCDRCVPTLEFEQKEALLPDMTEEIRQFSKFAHLVLQSTDFSQVCNKSFFEAIDRHDLSSSVLAHARQQIELNPAQVNAYLVAARLSSEMGLPEAQSWRNKGIEVGFQKRISVNELSAFLDERSDEQAWSIFIENMPENEGMAWLESTLPPDHPYLEQAMLLFGMRKSKIMVQEVNHSIQTLAEHLTQMSST